MLTILWWVLIALCLCFGFLGCFINKVPGPIAVVIATLLAILCLKIPIEWSTFGIITALAIASMIISKLLVKLVKKLQEYSKRASWGTTIGSIIGLLLVWSSASSDSKALLITMLIVVFVVLLSSRCGGVKRYGNTLLRDGHNIIGSICLSAGGSVSPPVHQSQLELRRNRKATVRVPNGPGNEARYCEIPLPYR